MLMRQVLCLSSFALGSAHEKFDVCLGLRNFALPWIPSLNIYVRLYDTVQKIMAIPGFFAKRPFEAHVPGIFVWSLIAHNIYLIHNKFFILAPTF